MDSLSSEPLLIVAALISVYLVLGILYESYVHPVTILSTLPSAGVGALLALMLTHTELTVIAIIGIILLIGLVKKNAILMIDFALAAERNEGKSSRDSIYEACLLRFRPIMMTTMAAMLGAVPLALGTRHGLGIPPSPGNRHHRRAGRQPVTDVVHHPGGVSLFRPPSELVVPGSRAGSRSGQATRHRHGKLNPMLISWMTTKCAKPPRPKVGSVGGLPAFALITLAGAVLFMASCMVGPNYKRPPMPAPPTYKELPPPASPQASEWSPAQPNDAIARGKWWEIYNDPELNALEEQVSISNQNVIEAEAQFREAKFAVKIARSNLYPTISVEPSIVNWRSSVTDLQRC